MGPRRTGPRPVALDAGALIALESPRGRALLRALAQRDTPVVISAGAVAQAARDLRRQALLARLLTRERTTIAPLDRAAAVACGRLLARSNSADAIDAHVVLSARAAGARMIVTSDPGGLRRLDASVILEPI